MWKLLAVAVAVAAMAVGFAHFRETSPTVTIASRLAATTHGPPRVVNGLIVFTKDQLKLHDGSNPDLPLLLCILGEVFDVSDGAKFYAKGEGYNVFLGQDSSRSFHSGDWTDVNDDVRDLNVMAIQDVTGWREFYRNHKVYRKVGVVVGLYFDENGLETEAFHDVEKLAAEADTVQAREDDIKKMYPGCDMLHEAAKRTTRIECSSPDEKRFPRLMKWIHSGTKKETARCACFTGRELSRNLPVGVLEVYDGCQPHENVCLVYQ